jgi:hypothetical protein
MVGPIWIATSSWVTGSHPPQLDDDSLSSWWYFENRWRPVRLEKRLGS